MKWKVRISEVGYEVKDLLKASKQFDLVIQGKRKDMKDFTVHFDGELPKIPFENGDEIVIGGQTLYIIALGDQANKHLLEHGACTIDFSGGMVPSGSDAIMVDGDYHGFDFIYAGAKITVK